LQAGGRVHAFAEIRRGGKTSAAVHLAGCHVDGAVHLDGKGPGEERRDRTGGARAAAGPGDGSQQSHSPPFARTGLPGTRQDGRGGARTEAVRTVAGAAERETLSEVPRQRKYNAEKIGRAHV